MRITLTVTAGPHEGKVFTFVGHDTFLVGRSKRAHFRLPFKDRYFSRIHFMIEVNPPVCGLMDMGSRNGTYVNSRRVDRCALHDGDRIRAGRSVLTVSIQDAPTEPPPPRPEVPADVQRAGTPTPPPVAPPARPSRSEGPTAPLPIPPLRTPAPPPLPPVAPLIFESGLDEDFAVPLELPSSEVPAPLAPSLPPASEPKLRPAPPPRPPAVPQPPTVTVLPAPAPAPSPTASSSVEATGCRVCGLPLMALSMSAVPGVPGICPDCQDLIHNHEQAIPGFHVVRELGRGSMGVVSLALRDADSSLVALKTIIPAVAGSPAQVERFLREANILRELNHPHIVAFRDMGETHGIMYFAMDYVPGLDASKQLRKQGPFPIARAVTLVCQLLDALHYAHSRGFVHRDVKPSNLLVTDVGGREAVKVADFGLARVYQSSQMSGLTMTGDIGGTVAFMPPEQITDYRDAQPPADQYSAGATLYNLLSGAYIYDLPTEFQKQLLMILHDDPVPIDKRRRDVPRGLAAVLQKALAREPQDRYPSCQAFREALLPYGG